MAPYMSDEVDVFTVPHTRMKELVNCYNEKMRATNFSDDNGMQTLLETLLDTFVEFKTHEQIENKYIMRKLKNKLKKLSIQNTAVCNCHKDNYLIEMMLFIKDGYSKKTEQDRENFGTKLQQELEAFTETFIPHMKEEEEVFQPLLEQYFSVEELKAIKEKVIQQHLQKVTCRQVEVPEWFTRQATTQTSSSSESDEEHLAETLKAAQVCEPERESPPSGIEQLPRELLQQIFSHLNPRDLCQCARVSISWNIAAMDPVMWRDLYPVKWAQGNWTYRRSDNASDASEAEDADEAKTEDEEEYYVVDEDADIDEKDDVSEKALAYQQMMAESQILNGLVKHLLPISGSGVHKLVLSNSKALTSGKLQKILEFCPNLEYLDISYTKSSDVAFKKIHKSGGLKKLHTLICAGCQNITDDTLLHITTANTHDKQKTSDFCYCEKYMTRHTYGSKAQKTGNENAGPREERCDSGITLADYCHTSCSSQLTDSIEQNIEECASRKANHVMPDGSPVKFDLRDCTGETSGGEKRNDRKDSDCVSYLVLPSGSQGGTVADFCDKDYDFGESLPLISRTLKYVNFSGCCYMTDMGMRSFASLGPFPVLRHLDLSGCYSLTSAGLEELTDQCPSLDPAELYYCDNITDGPFPTAASGCRNLECETRACCRKGH